MDENYFLTEQQYLKALAKEIHNETTGVYDKKPTKRELHQEGFKAKRANYKVLKCLLGKKRFAELSTKKEREIELTLKAFFLYKIYYDFNIVKDKNSPELEKWYDFSESKKKDIIKRSLETNLNPGEIFKLSPIAKYENQDNSSIFRVKSYRFTVPNRINLKRENSDFSNKTDKTFPLSSHQEEEEEEEEKEVSSYLHVGI
jgi:hypothetical protein